MTPTEAFAALGPDELRKQVQQLEKKNIELQVQAVEWELQAIQASIQYFRIRGPMLEATLQSLTKQLEEPK